MVNDTGQQLYKKERTTGMGEHVDEWTKVINVANVRFWDTIMDENGDEQWIEFEFSFKKGKIDTKELVALTPGTTKKERKSIDKMWDTEQEIFNKYRAHSKKYRFFSKIEDLFQKMTNWARKKHSLPLKIREKAYKKSGRLKKDPNALKLYNDL